LAIQRLRNVDTVEEFWDVDSLRECFAVTQGENITRFAQNLLDRINPSGSLVFTHSGRSALELALRASADSLRDNVLICSFNCHAVAQAVKNAGLNVKTYDLGDKFGRLDCDVVADAIDERTLAVVIPHFFGIPYDIRELRDTCHKHNIVLIEDCCHTLGGKIGSEVAGSLGDAAIFSFNYDKPISLGGGGALVINNQLRLSVPIGVKEDTAPTLGIKEEWRRMEAFIAFLEQRRKHITRNSFFARIAGLLKPDRVPLLGDIGPLRATLGIWLLSRYDRVVGMRTVNAERIARTEGITTWNVDPDVTPAWLKQKVLCDRSKAGIMSHAFQRVGIRIGRFNWPETIDELSGMKPRENAYHVAKNWLDVPVHQNMPEEDVSLICEILRGGRPALGLARRARCVS
jgi:dTDP-4-amino-4,6-dideoxygalactose transaminase